MQSRISRFHVTCSALLTGTLLSSFVTGQETAPPETATSETATAESGANGANEFALPANDPAGLLEFVEAVAQRAPTGNTIEAQKAHVEKATTAILQATDSILKNESSTTKQIVDAIEWRIEAFSVREQFLSDREAGEKVAALVTQYKEDPRQEVVASVARVEMMRTLRRWPLLNASERADFFTSLKDLFGRDEPVQLWQVGLLMQSGDMLGDSDSASLVAELFESVLPKLQASDSPEIKQVLPSVEGLARRVSLPGKTMELEGSLLDGTQLNWSDYRGKVVLVDYWATWCGPCKEELPNVLENYRLFHDKGFDVLGICLNDDRSDVASFLQQENLPWKTMFSDDPASTGWDHPMAVRYAITGIPRAILVDQNGVVIEMNARGPKLRAALQRLLGDPATAETSQFPATTGDSITK